VERPAARALDKRVHEPSIVHAYRSAGVERAFAEFSAMSSIRPRDRGISEWTARFCGAGTTAASPRSPVSSGHANRD
jgi:hypothetical protein